MINEQYDAVVIGGGSAGYAATRTLTAGGMKVAVIDGAEELGGLCILRGCMPSKTLIESAKRFSAIQEAGEFGINVEGSSIDIKKVFARKRFLIDDFKGYRQDQLENGKFTLIRGYAKFTSSHEMEVKTEEETKLIKAKYFVIATGSSIFVPEIDGLKETGFITSDDVLEDEILPESVTVLGGGAIALEMAYYYAASGSKVTVIQRSQQILSTMDADIANELQLALEALGITFYCGTKITSTSKTNGGLKALHFTHDGESKTVESHEILCALGRRANSHQIDCDAAGVELNRDKIIVNSKMQTSQEHIFAAGDICSPLDVVHIAIDHGEIAADNALAIEKGETSRLREVDYTAKLLGIFTEPQVATVGLTEVEAKERNLSFKVESYPFNDHGKSMVHGTEHGFVKIIAEVGTKKILGAAVVGPEGVELIHELVVAISLGATVDQLAKIPHYHPTLSEIWTYPAEDLADELA